MSSRLPRVKASAFLRSDAYILFYLPHFREDYYKNSQGNKFFVLRTNQVTLYSYVIRLLVWPVTLHLCSICLVVFVIITILIKASKGTDMCLTLPKYWKFFDSVKSYSSNLIGSFHLQQRNLSNERNNKIFVLALLLIIDLKGFHLFMIQCYKITNKIFLCLLVAEFSLYLEFL